MENDSLLFPLLKDHKEDDYSFLHLRTFNGDDVMAWQLEGRIRREREGP